MIYRNMQMQVQTGFKSKWEHETSEASLAEGMKHTKMDKPQSFKM